MSGGLVMWRRLPTNLIIASTLSLALVAAAHAQSSMVQDGKTIAFDRNRGNCLSCHDIKGGDLAGTIGPPLGDMKARFPNRDELIGIVTDETHRNPQTVMPPFGRNLILTDKEISAIVDFLYSL
jgi:sulfur-oxidizing protein SoxX